MKNALSESSGVAKAIASSFRITDLNEATVAADATPLISGQR